MSEEQSWKEKALNAIKILEKISQPPLQYATVLEEPNDRNSVDIALADGQNYVVHFDPRLKDQLKLGATVQISPETYAIVRIGGDIQNRSASVVKDILDDGRIKIEDRGREKIVLSAINEVKIGNSVLVDNSYSVIVEDMGNMTKAYKLDTVPKLPWSAIGGLEKTIEEIKDAIELPFIHKEIYSKFPNKKPIKGALLYGPPGCGKTMLGKAIAYNLAISQKEQNGGKPRGHFLYVAGPEFLQKFVGVGAEKVRELFTNARETAVENNGPVVIFIDEPEAVLKQRGSGISSDASDPIVNQFLVEMDGLNGLENVMVLLATNREEMLDSAVLRPGRIDRKVYVPRPNQADAEQIFGIYLNDMPLEDKKLFKRKSGLVNDYAKHAAAEVFGKPRPVIEITYRDGLKDTIHYKNMFSGASVVSIVDRGTDIALKRGINGGKSDLTKDDLSEAVEKEYFQNRTLTNQITKDDLKSVAKEKFDKIVDMRPSYWR